MKKWFLILLLPVFTSCHIGRMVVYNVADVNDYKKSPQLELKKSSSPVFFEVNRMPSLDSSLFPSKITSDDRIQGFNDLFTESKTTSFTIIRRDTIIFEKYFYDYESSSVFTSFSVAKSFISALVGMAIADGKIGSVNDSITQYLNFNHPGFGKITIAHLLNMESGIRFRENYFNPFAEIGRYYYGNHLEKYVPKLKIEHDPGQSYEYRSINTLLLGMIVEKATGMPLQNYFQQKLWTPLGMEFDASLNADSKKGGQAKCFTGLNARARDYARFGRLYLHKGNWYGTQVLPEEWVLQSITPRPGVRSSEYYQYQWRTDNDGNFWAQGLLGQFVFVSPRHQMIIVRTGKTYGPVNWPLLMAHLAKKL